jgi:solute carrier family 35 (UDP-sugar transporter), member A1/2/3
MDEELAVPLIQRDGVSSTSLTTINSAYSARSDCKEVLPASSPPPLPFRLSSYPCTTFSCQPTWDKRFFHNYSLKSVLLVLLAIQGSSAIVIGRYTRFSAPEEELYEIRHLVLVIECVKFLLSILAECISTEGNLWESLEEHIFKRPIDSCKVLVPAILYVIQNSLVYIALSNLSAPVFISLQQGKLIATALVSVTMLRRTYSLQQWACLFVLAMGVAIVALDESRGDSQGTSQNRNEDINVSDVVEDIVTYGEQYFVVGVVAVTGACFSSAFAGVYFEMVLAPEKAARTIPEENTTTTITKNAVTTSTSVGPSLWIRNIQLAFFSIIFCIAQGAWESRMDLQIESMEFDDDEVVDSSSHDQQGDDPKPFFHGFTAWVW